MRISDWSSDVCSSDLFRKAPMALGPWRAPASLFCWLVAALSAAPVAALAWRAGWDGFAELPLWIGNGVSNSLLPAALAATVIRSEEHTSELQSLMRNSYAVFCLKKKNNKTQLRKNYDSNNSERKKTMSETKYDQYES